MANWQIQQMVRFVLILTLALVGYWSQVVVAQSGTIADVLTGSTDAEETRTERNTIEPNKEPGEDKNIENRLKNIFSEIDGLANVEVVVSNSVVTLSGSTNAAGSITRAENLASQVEGVAEVLNGISVNNDVSERVATTVDRLTSTLQSLITTIPILLLAIATTVVAWLVGKRVSTHPTLFRRVTPNAFIAELLGNICWIFITLLGVFVGLSLLDATSLIGTVLGAAGILGLAIGFAVKDTVENYIASILLSLRNPFKTRDFVSIGEFEGSVARLTSRATILISIDGNHIRIPNSTVFKSSIVNYTRNPQRRYQFTVGVDTEVELGRAQALALTTVATVPGVLPKPASSVVVDELGDSNVSLIIKCWVDQRTHDITKVRSESIRQVKHAFDKAGIVMPEPIYRVLMSEVTPGKFTAPSNAAKSGAVNRRSETPEAVIPASERTLDSSADTTTVAALEAEILKGEEDNLLVGSAPHE